MDFHAGNRHAIEKYGKIDVIAEIEEQRFLNSQVLQELFNAFTVERKD